MNPAHFQFTSSRRDFLSRAGAGFGALALADLLKGSALAAAIKEEARSVAQPLLPRQPHFAAKAKSVIFLFMEGGPSHLDTFDPKPALLELAGKPIPQSFGRVITAMGEFDSPILASKRQWKQHGQSGTWVSDWLPETATCVDDIAVIRSCWADGINHSSGVCQMNTGSILAGRPSLGAWTSYGLGTENQNLPAFVVMQDNAASVINGPRNWGAGFMPASYQGTRITAGSEPIPFLNPPEGITAGAQRGKLDFLTQMNRAHAATRAQSELEARIASYELAFRMQSEAPEAVDFTKESEATKALYGIGEKDTADFGRMCLLSRRLVERGVRFVQLFHEAWDQHGNLTKEIKKNCENTDQASAALVKDLKQRGLLDDTLVVWGGEFGRTPMVQGGNDGRDHHNRCYSYWLAGAGLKKGHIHGETDELGFNVVRDPVHVHDLNATLLHLLGFDHEKLTYRFQGRDYRLTDVHGHVVKGILV